MNRKKKSMKKKVLAWMLAAGMVVSGCSGNRFVMKALATTSEKSGYFGNNKQFSYKISNGKLLIQGKGDMPNFDKGDAPWKDELELTDSNSIKVIEIGEGITSIRENAFNVSDNDESADNASASVVKVKKENTTVTKVVLPTTLTKIDSKAFANLKQLNTLIIGSSIPDVTKDAFYNSAVPKEWCYLGKDTNLTSFGGMSLNLGKDSTIVITKHYYDSEGKAENYTTDKFIPGSIVEDTNYEGKEYDITAFPFSEKDKGYTWYKNSSLTGDTFKNDNIGSSTTFDLYGKKNVTSEKPSESPSATPTATPSGSPTAEPSGSPSTSPSAAPTKDPVTPKQEPVIGTVTCTQKVLPTTSYDKVTLTRSDNSIPGTLKLKPVDFNRSGSNQCEYIFTPSDSTKYSEVTGKVVINVEKDTLTSIDTEGSLQKGSYKYGEKFDISGLKVIAKFQSGNSKDVTNYVKTTELKLNSTSVDISYTYDSVTKKVTFKGFVVEKGDTPDGAPKDTEVANTIKTVSAASSTVLGSGSKWQFDSTKLSTVIPAGGSVEVTATYKGSDASSYTNISKTIKISRQACVDDNKIVYTGAGEKAPTCTTDGVGHTVCSKCGDTMRTNVTVSALGHKIEYIAAKNATCTEKGNDAYYKCANCNKTYVDSAGKTETTVKTYDALGHKYDGQKPTYSWASDHKTCVASIKCKVCNSTVTETAESVCSTLTQATCQSEGEALYMVDFKNTAFSVQFEYGKLPRTGHSLKKIEGVEATETEAGSIEYYECTVCKKIFYDSNGAREITDKSDIIIPAKGVTPTAKPSETNNPSEPSETNKPSATATPKPKGTSIRDTSGSIYKITNSSSNNPTVEYNKTTAVVGGSVKIKDTVKVLGVTYKITSIADGTFKNNKKITSVTIGNNVEKIGKSAFEKCKKLKSVTLGKKVESIGKNAFKNCSKLNTITIKTTKLDSDGVKKGAFSGIRKEVIVKVPKSKYNSYKKLLRNKGLNKKVKIKKI